MRKVLFATLALPVLTVLFAARLPAQTVNASPTPAATPTPSPSPEPLPDVEVMYTGKLLGYFRVPSLQPRTQMGCPKESDKDDSTAAIIFRQLRNKNSNAVLLGTGDNFAPELEARVFNPVGEAKKQTKDYQIENKELYVGTSSQWFPYQDVPDTMATQIKLGKGTIPADNVGCFLRTAGFKALVPGKHDFYFGVDRVRQYARFLAEPGASGPVQMLGANLVIKTAPTESVTIPEYAKKPNKFDAWPENISIQNLGDGKTVYPWFTTIKIKLAEPKSNSNLSSLIDTLSTNLSLSTLDDSLSKAKSPDGDLETVALAKAISSLHKSLELCSSKLDPNDIQESDCRVLTDQKVTWDKKRLMLSIALPSRADGTKGFYSTLEPGKNFLICTRSEPTRRQCSHFSSFTPFFYYPHDAPETNATDGYTDPDPYVLDKSKNVAIFGVVDPAVAGQIGILNLAWTNTNSDLTTKLSIEDPVEALTQQLDYFEKKEGKFDGLKILLAQTTPEGARALAARFPKFQLIISGADLEQGTSELRTTAYWTDAARSSGSFVAVPTPYYDASKRVGSVYGGLIKAFKTNPSGVEWKLEASNSKSVPVEEKEDSADGFWNRVRELKGCLNSEWEQERAKKKESETNTTYLKWLVLCSMQKQTGADIALIQTRDLFDQIPKLPPKTNQKANRSDYQRATKVKATNPACEPKPNEELDEKCSDSSELENTQQMLDRLIWKGDLITLLYVPGKSLKKALDQSNSFDKTEKSSLTLSVERGRKLETLGVRTVGKEYFINELLVEDNKYYAVATTDFIGAGDTGYPDLVKDAINPRTNPQAFTENLVTISSLACRQLFATEDEKNLYCLPSVINEKYMDRTSAKETPPYKKPNPVRAFWDNMAISWPKSDSATPSVSESVERRVRRRSFWNYSLRGLSFTLNDFNKNLSDKEVSDKFSGVPSTEVTAKESLTIDLSLDNRISYSAFGNEFFVGGGFNYKKVSTSDGTLATPGKQKFPDISYQGNRVFGEMGYVIWRLPGRDNLNLGVSASLYAETQLVRPFSIFTLGSDDDIKISQNRSLLLLPRLGLRWQNRANYAEVGMQRGRQLNVLNSYVFDTSNGPITCSVDSKISFKKCIKDAPITIATPVHATLSDSPRAGFYWKGHIAIPIINDLKFEFDEEGDFFLENSRSTSIDTRRREMSKFKFTFPILPNLTLGPTVTLLRYRNQINKDFLFQHTVGVEMKWSFDVFNRREKGVQITHKSQ